MNKLNYKSTCEVLTKSQRMISQDYELMWDVLSINNLTKYQMIATSHWIMTWIKRQTNILLFCIIIY